MPEDSPDEPKRRPGHMYDPAQPLPDHLRPKQEAEYRYRVKDRDVSQTVFRLKSFTWSLTGALIGALIGGFVAARTGQWFWLPLLTLASWAFSYFGTLALAEGASSLGSSLYFARGSIPVKRQYSLADALAARGKYEEAAAELERAAQAWPDDPDPPLRLARLLRDALHRDEEALRWFRQAIVRSKEVAFEIGVTRELIELIEHRIGQPRRALPDLARLADRHPDTPGADWARRGLVEIKRTMQEEDV